MKKTIIIDSALCAKIEALQYEVECRKDVIVQVLAGTISIKGDQFKVYQDEYKQYFIDYNKAKQEMLDKYEVSDDVIWSLDFQSMELTLG